MQTIIALHEVDADHLAKVVADMKKLGAPTIRVIDLGGDKYALEGTHRLAAAAQLGLVPEIIEVVPGDVVDGLEIERWVTPLTDTDEWTYDDLLVEMGERRYHGAIYRLTDDAFVVHNA